MPPADYKRKWIKLWIDECLTGTVREDLTPEERSVWYDFLLLAGRNRPPGCISANEKTPLSPDRLSAILNISTGLLANSTKKFDDEGRISIDKKGIMHITNWGKYQYTDYDRQKPSRQKTQQDDLTAYLDELRLQYPEVDVSEEWNACQTWWAESGKKMAHPKSALRNWIKKAREINAKPSLATKNQPHETTAAELKASTTAPLR